jgi:hypothetical protein
MLRELCKKKLWSGDLATALAIGEEDKKVGQVDNLMKSALLEKQKWVNISYISQEMQYERENEAKNDEDSKLHFIIFLLSFKFSKERH